MALAEREIEPLYHCLNNKKFSKILHKVRKLEVKALSSLAVIREDLRGRENFAPIPFKIGLIVYIRSFNKNFCRRC